MENLQGEIWKDVVGFEGYYEISNKGRLKRLGRKILDGSGVRKLRMGRNPMDNNKTYYFTVSLFRDGFRLNIVIHRLVAMAFIPNPENKPFVNHIDANKRNNNVSNLEWVTGHENMRHASIMGLMPTGERNKKSKLKTEDVLKIKEMTSSGVKLSELAKLFSVNKSTICRIKNNFAWKAVTSSVPTSHSRG